MNIFRKLLKMAWSVVFIAILLGLKPVLAPAAPVATLTVNSLLDNYTNGDGLCTLREAVTAADMNVNYNDCKSTSYGDDTITFSVSGTITLGSTLPWIFDLHQLTIDGVGQNVTISGGDAARVLYVGDSGASLTLRNLSVVHGRVNWSNLNGYGAGVYSKGPLTIDHCTFSFNRSEHNGGAIYAQKTLYVTSSTFTSNNADISGGAIYGQSLLVITYSNFSSNDTFGSSLSGEGGALYSENMLVISDSTFSLNEAEGSGGAIYTEAAINVIKSTFSGNSADHGGALRQGGDANITNCTFSGNTATSLGGGILDALGSDLHVTNSSFSGNGAAEGGCLWSPGYGFRLKNTILANSVSGGNCKEPVIDDGNNIGDDATCGLDITKGSKIGVSPQLSTLGNYGGPTQTFRLLPGSPAIDGVIWNAPNDCPSTDQRGMLRPFDGDGNGSLFCDIGAYEKEIEIYLPLVRLN